VEKPTKRIASLSQRLFVRKSLFSVAALFLIILFSANSCSRWRKPKKVNNKFKISIPLPEDYPLLTKSIEKIIIAKFPEAEMTIQESLADTFEIAPFDEWLTQAGTKQILQLKLNFQSKEERNLVSNYLRSTEKILPIKISPDPVAEDYAAMALNISKSENILCNARFENRDLYERELCRRFLQSFCSNETKYKKKKIESQALCSLRYRDATQQASSSTIDLLSARELNIATFPLPIKANSKYPLNTFDEIDAETLSILFQQTSVKNEY